MNRNYVGKIVYARRIGDPRPLAAYVCVAQDAGSLYLVTAELSPAAYEVHGAWLSENHTAGWVVEGVVYDPDWVRELGDYLVELFSDPDVEWTECIRREAAETVARLRAILPTDGAAHAATDYDPDLETIKAAEEDYAAGRYRHLRDVIDELRDGRDTMRAEARIRLTDRDIANDTPWPDVGAVGKALVAIHNGDYPYVYDFLAALRVEGTVVSSQYENLIHTELDKALADESLRIRKLFGWA